MSEIRVAVGLDLTIPHPTVRYANVKPSVRIEGLNPADSEDVLQEQLQGAIDLAVHSIETIDDGMETVLRRLLSPEANVPGLRAELADLRATVDGVKKAQGQVVERLRSYNLSEVVERVKRLSSDDIPAENVPVRADSGGQAVEPD